MRQLTAFAAAILFATTLSSISARADYHFGPVKNGDQCWKSSPSAKDFGYWGACPQPASAPVVRTVRHARHH